VRNAGELVTQRQLLQEVWGRNTRRRPTTFASSSPKIGGTLEPDPRPIRYFITEARMGYRFESGGYEPDSSRRAAEPIADEGA
jgi:two-component system KDP operon response regulator KdpE